MRRILKHIISKHRHDRYLENNLTNAKELIDGTGGDFFCWTLSINNISKTKVCNLIGGSLATSRFLTYAGTFHVTYRDILIIEE